MSATARAVTRAQADALNPLAWLGWLAGIAAVPLVTRNPLYLTLALLVAVVVYAAIPRRGGAARAWRLFVTVGVSLAALSVAFNVLTVHSGDRVFAELPAGLPIVGGPLTWNAFAYGIVSALAISTLLIAAAAFNTAVRHADLIRLLPAGIAGLGIAGSLAITLVPQSIAAARDIWDAQRARGHRFRGPRDAGGLLVPLLAVALERAMTLAEALETRGFGASAADPAWDGGRSRLPLVVAALFFILALALLGVGLVAFGLAVLALGVLVALRGGRGRVRRSRYRTLAWSLPSVVVLAGVGLALASLALVPALTGASLAWDAFPRLVAPAFDPLVGAGIVLLALPAWWAGQ